MNNWIHKLKTELSIALIVSLFISLIIYYFVYNTGSIVLGSIIYSKDYLEKANEKYLENFQKYIKEEQISSTDTKKIKNWVNKHKREYLTLVIIHNGQVVFDGLYENEPVDTLEAYEAYFGEENLKTIEFADGKADIYFSGSYDYLFYTIWWIICSILFFLVLLILFLGFIRKKVTYIVTLEKEIKILETGGLEYEITVQGKDELASLANSLNQMRLYFIENMKNEEMAVQTNYNLVASMSHDLRTPLTSMILYLGLIKEKRYSSPKELEQYIEKSYEKAIRIQHMSNQLFERFLISENRESEIRITQKIQYIFEDTLSDMVSYLSSQGYEVESNISWPDAEINAIMDYIPRIIDNISSNILKYSHPSSPVQIWFQKDPDYFIAVFKNKIYEHSQDVASSKIGVQNICIMMKKMGGLCKIQENNCYYTIELWFKIAKEKSISSK